MTTSIDFPSALMIGLQGSLSGSRQETWVADPSSVGSSRRRNRFTRSLKSFQFTLRLTQAEFTTLEAFYNDDLSKGVLTCNWIHPLTSVSYEMFLSGAPQEKHLEADLYDVSVGVSEA